MSKQVVMPTASRQPIWNKSEFDGTKKVVLTPSGVGEGVFPVVLLKVDGIITRALIDTGAGSSYVSAKVRDMLNKKPCEPQPNGLKC